MGYLQFVAIGVANLCVAVLASRNSEPGASGTSSTQEAELLPREDEPCGTPEVGDLHFFLNQCEGRCSRAKPRLAKKFGRSEVSRYFCQSRAPKHSAAELWRESAFWPPPQRQLAFKDAKLWEAMSLSLQVSEFEIISDERQQMMDHADSMDEFRAHMGVGANRAFTSHMTRKAAAQFAARSLRGEHASNEDALWWLETTGIAALAMFDGHGGPEVSDDASYAALRAIPAKWLQYLQSGQDKSQFSRFWSSALKAHLAEFQATLREQKLVGGSTASIVVSDKETGSTVVAWMGDTQVLHAIPKGGDSWELEWISNEHVCTIDQAWKDSCGAHEDVVCQQQDGHKPRACNGRNCIGVTRALGDKHLFDLGLLVASPETHELRIQSGDVLLVASDGVWDMLHADDVVSALRQGIHDVAHYLTVKATALWRQAGQAPDDISVVLWHAQLDTLPARKPSLDVWSPAAPRYKLHQSNPSFLAKGEVGDWCQQLRKAPRGLTGAIQSLLSYPYSSASDPESTCGYTLAASFKAGGHAPVLRWVALRCYSRESSQSLHPPVGGYGVCAIPNHQACGMISTSPSYGCRPGTLCVSEYTDVPGATMLTYGRRYSCEVRDS